MATLPLMGASVAERAAARGTASLPLDMSAESVELHEHFQQVMGKTADAHLFAFHISPDSVYIRHDKNTDATYVALKLRNADIRGHVPFPVVDGHITVAHYANFGDAWQNLWRCKAQLCAARSVTCMVTAASNSFDVSEVCELYSIIELMRETIQIYHIDDAAKMEIVYPGAHITFCLVGCNTVP